MSKEYFLQRLEYLLSDVPQEEREAALSYYRDYFEEAGAEKEQEVLNSIGSPEKVSSEIKSSFFGDADKGEYTERGYYDERFDEKHSVPDTYAKPEREKGRNAALIILLFLFFGIPAAATIISAGFSAIAGIIGAIFGAFGGLIGLVAGGFAVCVALFVTGISLIVGGIANFSNIPVGLMCICLGFFLLAAAMLAAVFTKWGALTVIPSLFRLGADLVRRCFEWFKKVTSGLMYRIFGRGGETR